MPTEKLRCAMYDQICAVDERPLVDRGWKRVVYDNGSALFVPDSRKPGQIENF